MLNLFNALFPFLLSNVLHSEGWSPLLPSPGHKLSSVRTNCPPISTRPCPVSQLEWSALASTKVWLVIQEPEEKDRQVVAVVEYDPPQISMVSIVLMLSMVCSVL